MLEISDVVKLCEKLRDQAGSIVSEIGFSTDDRSSQMRWYFMGASDSYATLVSLLVNGDPEIALNMNFSEIWNNINLDFEGGGYLG